MKDGDHPFLKKDVDRGVAILKILSTGEWHEE